MSIIPKTFYDDKSYFLYIDPSSHVISQSKTLQPKSAEKTTEKICFVLATDHQAWFWPRLAGAPNEVGYCNTLTKSEAFQVCHYIESSFTSETAQALGIDSSAQRIPRPISFQERIFCKKTAYIVGGIAIATIILVGFCKFDGITMISNVFVRLSPKVPSNPTPSTQVASPSASSSTNLLSFESSKLTRSSHFPVNWKHSPSQTPEQLRMQG